MYAAGARCREQEPGTGIDIVFRRIRTIGIEFGEPALSARQTLFGCRQQPLDRLDSVAFDDIPVVVEMAVIEDAEIELRRSLTAFGGNPEAPHHAVIHCSPHSPGGTALLQKYRRFSGLKKD